LYHRPRDWGALDPKVETNFLNTLPGLLFKSKQFSKVVSSAYDPWGWRETKTQTNHWRKTYELKKCPDGYLYNFCQNEVQVHPWSRDEEPLGIYKKLIVA